ncbi:MAG TPA: galactokinase [Lachnospiraceae bacterium]|nr:galactokinase [Lachnospiraceae bacterium]MDD7663994.1 galactokinase family protein [Lachnospiraceae bacterium]MDY4165684.1 galactokinase family protein [Lachnospiraceae bacterium]HAP03117.1 galactokinase [Lachnospiraceae bacterium]
MVKDEVFEKVYGKDAEVAKQRFAHLTDGFNGEYGNAEELSYFTAPGRTEIIGNHTDHNGGKVIAASIDLDTIGAASPSGDEKIEILSEGYKKVVIDLNALDKVPKESGTLSLVAGMAEAAKKMGYQVHGFKAYVTTTVIAAAGVSSSASFEMLFCAIVNHFFNDDKIPVTDYAKIGQYSENHFWNKASGLMDQMACAFGGPILLDFKGDISVEKIPFGFGDYGYEMVITNTGKGHADLSADYSAVPQEMFAVAKELGGKRLCDTSKEELLAHLNEIDEKIGNDRAILRAFHFFNETKRVEDMAAAVADKDFEKILALMQASGNSSYKLLQNCYTNAAWKEQKIALALALSEEYLAKTGKGICRVHGGGFAGVIQCVLPKEETDGYVDFMAKYFGRENVYPMNIRQTGAVFLG